MTKKTYMKPTMLTVELKHRTKILAESAGINRQLRNEEVDEGF